MNIIALCWGLYPQRHVDGEPVPLVQLVLKCITPVIDDNLNCSKSSKNLDWKSIVTEVVYIKHLMYQKWRKSFHFTFCYRTFIRYRNSSWTDLYADIFAEMGDKFYCRNEISCVLIKVQW